MAEPIFELRAHSSATTPSNKKIGPCSSDTEIALSQQLCRCRRYLEQHLVLLPEPYPGCILFFTVAAQGQQACVFYVRAATLEAAWREGATRVRQWAWARKQSKVELRVDWVLNIASLPNSDFLRLPPDPTQNWALADTELEHARLVLQQLSNEANETLSGFQDKSSPESLTKSSALLLGLQGVFIGDKEAATAVPRMHPLFEGVQQSPILPEALLRSTSRLLLSHQRPDGDWPCNRCLADHLGLTYTLLLIQRYTKQADLSTAIHRAFKHLEEKLQYLPHDHEHLSLAMLVMVRHAHQLHFAETVKAEGEKDSLHASMERVASSLLPFADSSRPDERAWSSLALSAFMRCNAGIGFRTAPGTLFGSPFQQDFFIEHFCQQHQAGRLLHVHWLPAAVIESVLLGLDSPPRFIGPPSDRSGSLREILQALSHRMVFPEQAIYLSPSARSQAAFFHGGGHDELLADARTSAYLLMTAIAALELQRARAKPSRSFLGPDVQEFSHRTDERTLDQSMDRMHRSAMMAPSHASTQSESPGISRIYQTSPPMSWDSSTLAHITGGTWFNLHQQALLCSGLDINRLHHLPGSAVLVRHAGTSIGIPPAALQTLQAAALISNQPHGLSGYGVPVLHVPRIDKGLRSWAQASRLRIKAPVVAATGCAGKTSILSMLRHSLQGMEDPRADALLAQDAPIQMINWSEAAPCALIELPLSTLLDELPWIQPDIVVISNLDFIENHKQINPTKEKDLLLHKKKRNYLLEKIIRSLRQGSTLVIDSKLGAQPCIVQAAVDAEIRLSTFGRGSGAHIRELSYRQGSWEISTGKGNLQLRLQSDGHHMAQNAQAVLATLQSLGKNLEGVQELLQDWQPLQGTGQPQLLSNGVRLLDHSQSSHIVSMQAAFTQLQAHAPLSGHRVIALAGIQAVANDLESSQLLLEPLIRSTQAKHVLLYGEPLRRLASALYDLPQVYWYDDLNRLVDFLLRTTRAGDTVLLAGRTATNLAIAADALRENGQEIA